MIYRSSGFSLAIAILLSVCSTCRGETLVIDLRLANNDPLIDFTAPLRGSPDRVRVVDDGLLVKQGKDKKGFAKRDTGFKFLLSASGDFKATLDLKKNRLEEPKSGWGQGLIFSVWLDDPEQTVLQVSLIALPNRGESIRAEKVGRKVKSPVRESVASDFSDGMLVVSRQGKNAKFEVVADGTATTILEAPVPTTDVRSVSVWCTRQDSGNTPAEFLIRNLEVQTDEFYSYQKSRGLGFSWWYLCAAFCLLTLIVASVVKLTKS